MTRFLCVPFSVRLTTEACVQRRAVAKRGRLKGQTSVIGIERCLDCPVGAAHAAGETASTWADGSPVELVAEPVIAPGSSRWTSAPEPEPVRAPRSAPIPAVYPPAAADRSAPRPAEPAVDQAGAKPAREVSVQKPRTTAKRYKMGERELTVGEWAREPDVAALELSANALYARLTGGCWTIEAALTTPKGAPNPAPVERATPAAKSAPKSKPAARASRPTTAKAASTTGPGHAALELLHEEINARGAELDRLEAAANALATALGLPAPYEVA